MVDVPAPSDITIKMVRKLLDRYRVTSGKGFRLKDHDPGDTAGLSLDKPEAAALLQHGVQRLAEHQEKLYAQNSWAMLCVFQALDAAGLTRLLRDNLGRYADTVLQTYRALMPKATPSELFLAIATARTMGIETIVLADRKAAQAAPVYRYRWDYASNLPVAGTSATLGAGHATDIGPTFANFDEKGLHGNGPGVKAASLNLSAIWAGFAHTGVARAPGVADWPRYTPRTRATMLVDEKCVLADDPDAAAREMWLKIDPRWG